MSVSVSVAIAIASVLATVGPGCLDSEVTSCSFGWVCPKGLVCEPIEQKCVPPGSAVCGNGSVEEGEECDSGPDLSASERNACRPGCIRARCGDGAIDSGELCDDGNTSGGDRCSADCRSTEVCGNAHVDTAQGELCDDGNRASGDGCSSTCQIEVLVWGTQATVPPPTPVAGGMVYDNARGVAVLADGWFFPDFDQPQLPTLDLWLYSGFSWQKVHVPPGASDQEWPAARHEFAFAADPLREVVVLFGGRTPTSFEPLGETWVWDGSAWHALAGPSPTARSHSAMTFDPNLGGLLLVGGLDGASERLSDAWVLDAAGWRLLTSEGPFGPRTDAALAHHADEGVTVLFGGAEDDATTWTFDGVTWTPTVHEDGPAARRGATLAYDAERTRLILYGGGRADADTMEPEFPTPGRRPDASASNELWFFSGGGWTPAPPATLAGARIGHSAAFDERRGSMVVAGGTCVWSPDDIAGISTSSTCSQAPWELGADWIPAITIVGPQERSYSAVAFHVVEDAAVLFGGRAGDHGEGDYLGDTWRLTSDGWTQLAPSTSPEPRASSALVYDRTRQRMVLFGGRGADDQPLDDTWELGPEGWSRISTATQPSARAGHGMAYDRDRQVVVLYGGGDSLGDLWEYDGETWRQVEANAAPGGFLSPSLVYDAWRRVLVLTGTSIDLNASFILRTETWQLGAAWELRDSHTDLFAARRPQYDDAARRLLHVSRSAVEEYGADGWTDLLPFGDPPARAVGPMVYDPLRRRHLEVRPGGVVLTRRSNAPTEDCLSVGDEDGDELPDCLDPDCRLFPHCRPLEPCAEPSADVNGNGLTECADPVCGGALCGPERTCAAGVCSCGSSLIEETCDDGVDEDCDGSTDCLDDDCRLSLDCVSGCVDADADGYGRGLGCLGRDCDDGDPSRYRTTLLHRDADGDNIGDELETLTCAGDQDPPGWVKPAGDCNDSDSECFVGDCCPEAPAP